MSHKECDTFAIGSRKWSICRDEAGLSLIKTNAYRVKWGMQPLEIPAVFVSPATQEEVVVAEDPIPEFIFHGHSISEDSVDIKKKLYGPGTELLRIYESAGAPTCPACTQLAQEMNNWGSVLCRTKIEEIVLDILPRAKAWIDEKHPWAFKLVPNKLEEYALLVLIRADVTKAIDESEKVINERRRLNLNVYTGEKNHVQRAVAGSSQRTNRTTHFGKFVAIPLIGKPIDRERLQSHIMYHIMPIAGDTEWVWRRHCKWLREVRHLYNGRLIVGIVTAGSGDAWSYFPPEVVKAELQGLGAEFVEAPNDTGNARNRKKVRQGIGEGVLFPLMLGMLNTADPDQIAFYGHCKGVTRPGAAADSAVNLWAEAMFETLFRNQEAAVAALDTNGVCGSFRMRGGYREGTPGIGSFWFYSGTFFAFRLVDAFKRNWSRMPAHYGCVEQWPRLNFDQSTQAACLFFDNVTNLYDERYWQTTITPAFEKWKSER